MLDTNTLNKINSILSLGNHEAPTVEALTDVKAILDAQLATLTLTQLEELMNSVSKLKIQFSESPFEDFSETQFAGLLVLTEFTKYKEDEYQAFVGFLAEAIPLCDVLCDQPWHWFAEQIMYTNSDEKYWIVETNVISGEFIDFGVLSLAYGDLDDTDLIQYEAAHSLSRCGSFMESFGDIDKPLFETESTLFCPLRITEVSKSKFEAVQSACKKPSGDYTERSKVTISRFSKNDPALLEYIDSEVLKAVEFVKESA
ncbi:hypothetical protein L1267_22220 [Pseudoalteromonas sp. OFAV1]|jgi:hypothetical protein|uniref:hypothetical protein n=1 Tax=Pseudoalteromonas sp. OFAV1 TaxID=2908892 RepID=UPI001F32596F|nr:hypothetical protein [Pseudoalteromonas sp. OFAV1]MCF2903089.1 hypothetical protein [Pseudoalteromonas sp. OFAV1]